MEKERGREEFCVYSYAEQKPEALGPRKDRR
jgi:hypothetical protein